MTDLILVGIQGSGKGTQARILETTHGYQIFETGGALRAMAAEDSDLGRKVKDITTRGDLVPNEIVMEIVQDFIDHKANTDKPIIFDGIPRFDEQRQTLEALLKKLDRSFQVLEIHIDEDEAYRRLTKRAQDQGRADDNPESIKKRIENFYTHTKPLLQIWKDQNLLISINGAQTPEEVTREIEEKLQES